MKAFRRMNRIRPCWAPIGTPPGVTAQLIREYIYLYGVVSPKDGTCVDLIMPTLNTACLQVFLEVLAQVLPTRHLADPRRRPPAATLPFPVTSRSCIISPYSPELNPKEDLWDEIREKIFKNYALKSMNEVRRTVDCRERSLM
jgi:hypothetical protein